MTEKTTKPSSVLLLSPFVERDSLRLLQHSFITWCIPPEQARLHNPNSLLGRLPTYLKMIESAAPQVGRRPRALRRRRCCGRRPQAAAEGRSERPQQGRSTEASRRARVAAERRLTRMLRKEEEAPEASARPEAASSAVLRPSPLRASRRA
jgi:hypothetical protein